MERYRKIFPNCWYLAEEGASGSAASGPAHRSSVWCIVPSQVWNRPGERALASKSGQQDFAVPSNLQSILIIIDKRMTVMDDRSCLNKTFSSPHLLASGERGRWAAGNNYQGENNICRHSKISPNRIFYHLLVPVSPTLGRIRGVRVNSRSPLLSG